MKLIISLKHGKLTSVSGHVSEKDHYDTAETSGSNGAKPDLAELIEHEDKMAEKADAERRKKFKEELGETDEDKKKKKSSDDGLGLDDDDSDLEDDSEDEDDEDLDLSDEALGLDDEDEEDEEV